MLLRVEFITGKRVHIREGGFFTAMLLHRGSLLPGSRRQKVFTRQVLDPGQLLSALGGEEREEKPGSPLTLDYSLDDGVSLLLYTDLFFTEADLAQSLEIRLLAGGREPFTVPARKVEWTGRGMFTIDIGYAVKALEGPSLPSAVNS
jgi:hypothetical protein